MRFLKTRIILFIAAVITVIAAAPSVRAGAAAVVPERRIDLSKGYISGETANYKFYIPQKWKNYVYVDRMIYDSDPTGVLERLDFYCVSQSGRNKPEVMFSLYVYDYGSFSKSDRFDALIERRDNAFAVIYSDSGGFDYLPDRMIYESVIAEADSQDKLDALIETPGDNAAKRTVFINNAAIFTPPEVINGLYYIPLREAAEALGYTVNWLADYRTVEILKTKPKFADRFIITALTSHRPDGIKVRLINGRTYVHTQYFTLLMNESVTIDDNGDVYINDRK